jgi:hypothetical protein
MKIFCVGSGLFALAFFIHLSLWKIKIPRRQTKVLLVIFIGTLILGFFGLWILSSFDFAINFLCIDGLIEYLHISLFFISLLLAYVVTYSALEVDSPSLVMVMNIANAGEEGIDEDVFDKAMTDEILVMPRLRDLVTDQMAFMDGNKYRLTIKGESMARMAIFYRKLLNSGKGG